jgi:Flp pilus assembly protein TadB
MERASWILALVAVLGVAAVSWSIHASRRRNRALVRLDSAEEDAPGLEARHDTFPQRWRWIGPVLGIATLLLLGVALRFPFPFAIAFGLLVGVLGMLGEEFWAASRISLIEEQLAEAIDLMISSLRAGTPLLAALEVAREEARSPMREEMEEVVGRIRLGENPRLVIRQLAGRVPLETFRLFCHSLLVHWETGGSLAGTLLTIGRTIRDRIEVARRVRAQAVESQVSVLAVMAITYGVAALMLRTNPDPLRDFLKSTAGTYIAAATVFLESIGILWIWRMSQIRF